MTILTAAHWGVYEVEMKAGEAVALHPFKSDPDPSPIGLHVLAPELDRMRIRRPAIRRSWLATRDRTRRGHDAFVELPWDEALDLAAAELHRVKDAHGNRAIFGGSYGWSSAGRFHHAQSQIHRFLNSFGGYVRHQDSYSLGAARVLMPHILAPMDELMATHTSWDVLEAHTKLFVSLGGVPAKNAQVGAGGPSEHRVPQALRRMAQSGCRFVNISPTRDDLNIGAEFEWLPIRPNTDTALLLGMMHALHAAGLHDRDFLARCTTGFDAFLPYLLGTQDGTPKAPEWAAEITGIPAPRIAALAREMAGTRTMLSIAWSLQRAHHGEQSFWSAATLAAMLGQIGLPGGGIGVAYGPTNSAGSPHARFAGPTLPQGENRVRDFIPVARIADLLLNPGARFRYNGETGHYPDIRLVYWAGGNPFHHHQDLNRFRRAWQKPETIIVHEQFWNPLAKHADIVFPATTALERDDIGYATRERFMVAMKKVRTPAGEARDDWTIFSDLAARLGCAETYTENRGAHDWLRLLYGQSQVAARRAGVTLPDFDSFWQQGVAEIEGGSTPKIMFEAFRADPAAHPLKTPSGRIEIHSERIAGFALPDCPGHATWQPPAEFLGNAAPGQLHLLSDQPDRRLHSQLDPSPWSAAGKIAGRQPISMHPDDAAARGLADGTVVRVHNARGATLAGLRITPDIRPGVVRLSTGSWFDPDPTPGAPERHGNPNVLTLDIGASELSQGCIAQTCLVEVEAFTGPVPPITAHTLPEFVERD
jgi:biotin/methionine sulfoxide reductase